MAPIPAGGCDKHFRASGPAAPGFAITAEIESASGLIGQDRALAALEFGVGIRPKGFNTFALGA